MLLRKHMQLTEASSRSLQQRRIPAPAQRPPSLGTRRAASSRRSSSRPSRPAPALPESSTATPVATSTTSSRAAAYPKKWRTIQDPQATLTADEAASLLKVMPPAPPAVSLSPSAAASSTAAAAAESSPEAAAAVSLPAARLSELADVIRRGLAKEAKDLSQLEGAMLVAEQVGDGVNLKWVRVTLNSNKT